MKRPAVFFDRDNTLIVSDGYLGDPDGVVLVDGAAELVARVRGLGYAAVTFSNQSGVARGLFTEEDVHRVNSRLDEMLLDHEAGAVIDRHEFCPHHPEAAVARYRQASEFRKPSPGMIYQAARQLGLDLGRSWVVGDAPRDIEAGRAAGCRTILFKDPGLPPSAAAREPMAVEPDFIAASLKEVADLIENNPSAEEPEVPAPAATVDAPGGAGEMAAEASPAGPAPAVEPDASEPDVATDGPPAQELRPEVTGANIPELEAPQEQTSPPISPDLAAAGVEEPVAVEQDHASEADFPTPAATSQEEPEPKEQQESSAAPVEAAIPEEPASAPEQIPPPADEEDMDDTEPRGSAPSADFDSEGAVRRRSPPAVILAAKAAREAARNSLPDAPAEVLREVARNAAREAAMGITRDYSAPAAAPLEAAAESGPTPGDAADETPTERAQPIPQERAAKPEGTATHYAELAAREYRPTEPDQTGESGAVPSVNLQRLEDITEQILLELRSRHDPGTDFSVSKLMAGITMVISIAVLVYAYLYKDNNPILQSLLLLGLMLQAITISLLLMGRQK